MTFGRVESIALPALALSILLTLADRAPLHLDPRFDAAKRGLAGDFAFYLDGIADGTLPGPYAYRILLPLGIRALTDAAPGLSAIVVDAVLKTAFLFLIQLAFYRYLKPYLPAVSAAAGVLFLDVVIGYALTYIQGPSVAETIDLLNLLFFICGLIMLRGGNAVGAAGLLLVGSLNKEAIFFLLPVAALLWKKDALSARGAILCVLGWAAGFFPARFLIGPAEWGSSDWFSTEGIVKNIPLPGTGHAWTAFVGNFRTAVLLGPLLFLSLRRFGEQHEFLRSAFAAVPVYVVSAYLFSTVLEPRIWLPAAAILIPMAAAELGSGFGPRTGHPESV